ncbi:hypothetical protein AC578_10346 [Pseudocercospora eumusae]|uniref:F-box domain-containing protein n=1 Tax=Pseudocercospora eumusae TaxID=321146 RepID=A0A139HRH0_9PEZI|nr:hypothetical protein AC578_10346 [Pseudocercospora eumusae]
MDMSTAKRKTSANACREADQTDGKETTVVFASELMTSVQAARLKAHPGLLKNYSGRRMTLARHQYMFREAQRMKTVEAARIPQENIKAANLARKRKATFHFMDLPRELRDAVYDHLAHDIELGTSLYAKVTMEGAPRLSLLTVSRQVRKEYSESINRSAKLIISNRGIGFVPVSAIVPTQAMEFTAAVEIRLFTSCHAPFSGLHTIHDLEECTILQDIRSYGWLIREIAPQIRDLSILVHVVVPGDTAFKGTQWSAPLIGHDIESFVNELVYRCRPEFPINEIFVTTKDPWERQLSWKEKWSSAELYGTWTKQDGWRAAAEKTSEVGDG